MGALLLFSACGGLSDEDAARVNGTVITKAQVDARVEYHNNMFPGMVSREDEVNFPKILRQTTRDLVMAELEKQEAERRDITVTDAEVEAELARMADDDYLGDLEKMLELFAEMDVTREELSIVTRERLIHWKLVEAVKEDIPVSEYDIQTYREKNPKQFNQPERRQTRYIVSSTEADALAAADRVRAGESFVAVAKEVSVDPMAPESGGSLGLVAPSQLPPELEDVIFALEVGQISAPVFVAEKWYVITVEAVMPASEQMTEEEIRAEIKGIIASELAADRWKTLSDSLYDEAELEFDPDYDPGG